MAGKWFVDEYWGVYDIWISPWYLGVAHAFNFGVALADNEHVVMLGSDDTLEPNCIEECEKAKLDGLYYQYFPLRYMDTGEIQNIACNAAMVTKELWRHTGGFPVQSASGAPDCALLSIMMARPGGEAGQIVRIGNGEPLYNYRRHNETDTARNYQKWEKVILATRDLVTKDWQPK